MQVQNAHVPYTDVHMPEARSRLRMGSSWSQGFLGGFPFLDGEADVRNRVNAFLGVGSGCVISTVWVCVYGSCCGEFFFFLDFHGHLDYGETRIEMEGI